MNMISGLTCRFFVPGVNSRSRSEFFTKGVTVEILHMCSYANLFNMVVLLLVL